MKARQFKRVIELHLSQCEAELAFHSHMIIKLDLPSVSCEAYMAHFSSRVYCAEDSVRLCRRLFRREDVRSDMNFNEAARYYSIMIAYQQLGFTSYKP